MDPGSSEELLAAYFKDLTGTEPSVSTVLRPHASERRMYRLATATFSCIGVINGVVEENVAFVAFSRHFRASNLPVPEVYLYASECGVYLQQDLGDITLLDTLRRARTSSESSFPPAVEALYKTVLEFLPRFQIVAGATVDYAKCHPNSDFSSDALRADMELFSTELVPRLIPAYDADRLNRDFVKLIDFLAQARGDYFLYRDFQSRNIMIMDGAPWFIDFQGGRRGPLQYDVASLLYQSSARIPQSSRDALLNHYLEHALNYSDLDRDDFLHYLGGFIVSRMLQVLGVYGKEGLGAGKEYFATSIPAALDTLAMHLQSDSLGFSLPYLTECALALIDAAGVHPSLAKQG
jgi:aminoglycoside/choline kinase family phosphotransferase